MLKRGFAFALALVMLVSVASAVEAVTPDGDTYEVSAWAQKDVAEAWNVGLYKGGGYENYRMPADRSLLGQVAARLVALPSAGTMMPIPGIGGYRDRSRINRGAARWRRNWGCFRAVRMETWTTTPPLPGRRLLWFWRGPIGCIAMRSMMTRSHCPMPTAG